jgi:DNA mismatch repair protein MutS2
MRELRALRILEFQTIRDRLESHCETEIGRRLAQELEPLFIEDQIWTKLGQTSEAFDLLGTAPPPSMYGAFDNRKALKLANKGSVLGGTELYQIGSSLGVIRNIKSYVETLELKNLGDLAMGLIPDQKLEGELLFSLDSDGSVKDDASDSLAELRRKKRGAQARIIERIQAYVSGKTREYLSDPIYTVREGRYVIPLKADHKGKIRGIVHDTSATGQTVFLEPHDVLEASNTARQIEAQEREEEKRILTKLSQKVGSVGSIISGSLTNLGEFDLVFGKARLGAVMRATVPEKAYGHTIEIRGGRHPLLDPATVIPTDINLGTNANVLITGPNTGGKTVAIKAVGLFIAMMQSGLLPPAYHCKLGHFTQIWADIGDEQSIEQSLSTFSAHLKNIASAINNLQVGALVLLDEIGAGTDPLEGAALARAILTELHQKGAIVLASTHYGELKAFAFTTDGFSNASMEFDVKSLRPTYRLIQGAAGASQALRIAERYGIAKHIIERAVEQLSEQEQDVAEMLTQLENSQKQARAAQSEADKRLAELKVLEEKADRKLREAEDIRKRANERANNAIESSLREIRIQADDVFNRLKKQNPNLNSVQNAKGDLRALDDVGKELAAKFKVQERKLASQPVNQTFRKGDSVEVLGFTQNGILLAAPEGREVMVQMGALKMKIDLRKLTPIAAKAGKPRSMITLAKTMNVQTEITLRNKRAEVAIEELTRFIDDAILGNAPWVRIVHGKGEGILRQVCQEFLRTHKEVKSFRDGDANEGGQGVTIANFR